jgi:hypothetical protein
MPSIGTTRQLLAPLDGTAVVGASPVRRRVRLKESRVPVNSRVFRGRRGMTVVQIADQRSTTLARLRCIPPGVRMGGSYGFPEGGRRTMPGVRL